MPRTSEPAMMSPLTKKKIRKSFIKAVLWLVALVLGWVIVEALRVYFNPLKPRAYVVSAPELLTVHIDEFLGHDPVFFDQLKGQIEQLKKAETECREIDISGWRVVFPRYCGYRIWKAVNAAEDTLKVDHAYYTDDTHNKIGGLLDKLYKKYHGEATTPMGLEVKVYVANEGTSGGLISDAAKFKRDDLDVDLRSGEHLQLGTTGQQNGTTPVILFSNPDVSTDKWTKLKSKKDFDVILTVGNQKVPPATCVVTESADYVCEAQR